MAITDLHAGSRWKTLVLYKPSDGTTIYIRTCALSVVGLIDPYTQLTIDPHIVFPSPGVLYVRFMYVYQRVTCYISSAEVIFKYIHIFT